MNSDAFYTYKVKDGLHQVLMLATWWQMKRKPGLKRLYRRGDTFTSFRVSHHYEWLNRLRNPPLIDRVAFLPVFDYYGTEKKMYFIPRDALVHPPARTYRVVSESRFEDVVVVTAIDTVTGHARVASLLRHNQYMVPLSSLVIDYNVHFYRGTIVSIDHDQNLPISDVMVRDFVTDRLTRVSFRLLDPIPVSSSLWLPPEDRQPWDRILLTALNGLEPDYVYIHHPSPSVLKQDRYLQASRTVEIMNTVTGVRVHVHRNHQRFLPNVPVMTWRVTHDYATPFYAVYKGDWALDLSFLFDEGEIPRDMVLVGIYTCGGCGRPGFLPYTVLEPINTLMEFKEEFLHPTRQVMPRGIIANVDPNRSLSNAAYVHVTEMLPAGGELFSNLAPSSVLCLPNVPLWFARKLVPQLPLPYLPIRYVKVRTSGMEHLGIPQGAIIVDHTFNSRGTLSLMSKHIISRQDVVIPRTQLDPRHAMTWRVKEKVESEADQDDSEVDDVESEVESEESTEEPDRGFEIQFNGFSGGGVVVLKPGTILIDTGKHGYPKKAYVEVIPDEQFLRDNPRFGPTKNLRLHVPHEIIEPEPRLYQLVTDLLLSEDGSVLPSGTRVLLDPEKSRPGALYARIRTRDIGPFPETFVGPVVLPP